jgi:8-oxo-dGTP diphosphatase
MHVNARAIIERETPHGIEIVIQLRNKPVEGGQWLELPGGRVEEFESFLEAVKREVREETGLNITHIEGESARVESQAGRTNVECLQPFAVYQTTRGPVDSLGAYFRCRAEGGLLAAGDDTLGPRWMPVAELAAGLKQTPEKFSWIDQAGLLFYLQEISK